jgi:phosphoenolpyruvate phosphomutase
MAQNRLPRLVDLLRSASGPCFFMEAHNGISAKLAQEAGFKALWASGLTISASHGVRDANELSWTQVVDVVESMVDAARLPILVDGDTGFGDFNNARRLVKKLMQVGAAGVCIEDKRFPKSNSFSQATQELEDPSEFAGKIRACKDSAEGRDFVVVARIESLIAGEPMKCALERAATYTAAGADAVFIHSKTKDGAEIKEFCGSYDGGLPIVIAPTTYYSRPIKEFTEVGVRGVIWANHAMRASVAAIKRTVNKIARDASVGALEEEIASVQDLFRLVDQDELYRAEALYCGSVASPAKT